jgi:hypothetical protein
MFRCTAIFNKNDRRTGAGRQFPDKTIMGFRVAHYPATAVKIHDDRTATCSVGWINDTKPECVTGEADTQVSDCGQILPQKILACSHNLFGGGTDSNVSAHFGFNAKARSQPAHSGSFSNLST